MRKKHQKYIRWMRNYRQRTIRREGSLDNMCRDACQEMKETFPELHWHKGWAGIRGHNVPGAAWSYHNWMVSDEGKIYDPTRTQFSLKKLIYKTERIDDFF